MCLVGSWFACSLVIPSTQAGLASVTKSSIHPATLGGTSHTPHEGVATLNQQAKTNSPVYRFPEAWEYLKVGETTLRGLVASGKIPVVKIGRSVRFTQWALDEDLRSAESGSTKQTPEVRDATGEGVKTERW